MTTSLRRSRSAALVAALALAAGLSACGSDDTDDTATDPAASSSSPTPSEEPSEAPTADDSTSAPSDSGSGSAGPIPATGSAGITEAQVIGQTEGGGTVSELAFALTDDQAVADFSVELDPGLAEVVGQSANEMAQANPDATVYGAVTNIGCEPPRSVAINAGEAGFQVVPRLPKSTVQCLAPVTYVVLFAAPDA